MTYKTNLGVTHLIKLHYIKKMKDCTRTFKRKSQGIFLVHSHFLIIMQLFSG